MNQLCYHAIIVQSQPCQKINALRNQMPNDCQLWIELLMSYWNMKDHLPMKYDDTTTDIFSFSSSRLGISRAFWACHRRTSPLQFGAAVRPSCQDLEPWRPRDIWTCCSSLAVSRLCPWLPVAPGAQCRNHVPFGPTRGFFAFGSVALLSCSRRARSACSVSRSTGDN